ncbi:hypothetical protein [Streptomyces nigrescens]|uniref:hypothetical protein n=1 Tax=Streptomyces nigrescens TaxID=1920 RepID=UPI0036F4F6BD
MSTDHTAFDLAPSNGAATATRERPEPATPTKPTNKASKKKPANPDAPIDTTLGGVLIPGGVITGLIALCWMTHQFGLGPVIFGLLACAAAASAALAVKTRNAIRKATGRKGGGIRSAGGAGPGTRGVLGSAGSTRNPSGALSSTGRTGAGRSGGASLPSQARRSGSGFGMTGGGAKTTGPASRKPAGLGSLAKTTPSATGGRNNLPKQPGAALGKSAAATGGSGKPLLSSGKSAGSKGLLGGASKASGAGTGSGGKGGSRRGLLGRKGSTSGDGSLGAGTSSTGNGKPGGHKKGKNTGTGGATGKAGAAASRGRLGAFLRRNPTAQTQPATAKGHHKKKPTPGTPTSPSTPKQIKAAKKAAKAAKNNKGHNGTNPKPGNLKAKTKPTTHPKKNNNKSKKPWNSPSTNPHRAPIGPARRGAYWVGKKLRKHTSRKTRMRIKKVIGPVRSTVRSFSRFASPLLAHTVRFASRAILHSHMLLGTIRYTSAGPNWLRPLTRLLHIVTSPIARLVATSGSWRWMNSWIYRNTTQQPGTNTSKNTPSRPSPLTAGPHRAVTSPAATTAGTSTKGSTVSSIQHTMPLVYAAEAVRAAGVTLLLNPAENMVGYEATMRQLADVQHAIGQVVQAAGLSTQENFKVNPAVSDAYFDTAGYAHTVGERLGSIPDLFRIIHAEQIENIENPTPQGAKWDQSANNLAE